MNILFLHGYGSDPDGIRPTFLKESGYEVVHPALPDEDFHESARIAQQAFDEGQPDVVVGSSRGGAVAMNIDTGETPVVLIAPAWKKWGTATSVKAATIILHSANDDVVPIEGSRELLRRSGLADDHLVVAGENHRMVDEAAFGALYSRKGLSSVFRGPPRLVISATRLGLSICLLSSVNRSFTNIPSRSADTPLRSNATSDSSKSHTTGLALPTSSRSPGERLQRDV